MRSPLLMANLAGKPQTKVKQDVSSSLLPRPHKDFFEDIPNIHSLGESEVSVSDSSFRPRKDFFENIPNTPFYSPIVNSVKSSYWDFEVGVGLGTDTTEETLLLSLTGVTPGTYNSPQITVDSQGRITAITSGSPGDITGVTAGTGLTGGGTGGDVTLSLANTAVDPGSYTFASITVDAQGRITDAESSLDPSGGDVVTTLQQQTLTSKTLTSPELDGAPYVNGSYRSNIVPVAALNIDCSLGNYFTKTIAADSTFTVSNVPASRAYSFTLELTHTAGNVTWFSGVEWPGGTPPTLNTGKTHLIVFVTDDGGTRWRGAALVDYTN